MKNSHLVILNSHPDPRPARFCAALARAYGEGARNAGWSATVFDVGQISGARNAAVTADLAMALKSTCSAERLAVVLPVWVGLPPECLTYFLRLARALSPSALSRIPAHVVATMDMPGLLYRSQTAKNDLGQILPIVVSLPGVLTARHTLIGSVSAINSSQRAAWLDHVRAAGQSDAVGHAGLAHMEQLSA